MDEEPRKYVRVDLEHFQSAVAHVNAALRAFENAPIKEAIANMRKAFRDLLEAAQLGKSDDDDEE